MCCGRSVCSRVCDGVLPVYHLLSTHSTSSNVTLDLHTTMHVGVIRPSLPQLYQHTLTDTHTFTSDLLKNQTNAPSGALPPSLCELITWNPVCFAATQPIKSMSLNSSTVLCNGNVSQVLPVWKQVGRSQQAFWSVIELTLMYTM